MCAMAINAKIKFVQGATEGETGRAIIGTTGAAVTASDGNATFQSSLVSRYVWTMLDVPALSSLPSGLMTEGNITSVSFVPDVAGDYHLECIAYGLDGKKSVDRRVFRVELPSGRAIPAFAAEADAMNFDGQTRGWAPDMEAWLAFIEAGGGGSAAVGDDIAKSAGTTINRVRGLRGIPIAGGDGAPDIIGAVPTFNEVDGDSYKMKKPTPGGWYDPRDYGAVLDGETDDLPAFQAMHDAIPATGGRVHVNGKAWFSDTWRISKPLEIVGVCATGYHQQSGFIVAPGRTCLRIDAPAFSEDGSNAAGFKIGHLDIRSQLLIHWGATGNSLGYGIEKVFVANASVRKGDLYVALASAHPTLCFRCTDTDNDVGVGTFGLSEPTWNTTLGGTTSHEGMTFVTESIPSVRQNSTAYAVGARVFTPGDNRYVYECVTAGTTAGSLPDEMNGVDSALTHLRVEEEFTDGTCGWMPYIITGVFFTATLPVAEALYVEGFTGPGLTYVGGVGQIESAELACDVNGLINRGCTTQYCGCGIYISGSDANGFKVENFWAVFLGTLLPTPDIAAGAGYTGLGGHCLIDHSQAGGLVESMYTQLSSGRSILHTGIGRSTYLSCFEELGEEGKSWGKLGSVSIVIGGTLTFDPNSPGVYLNLDAGLFGTGIREVIPGTPTLYAQLSDRANSALYEFWAPEDSDPNFFGLRYNAAADGWWSLRHGNQAINDAYLLSSAAAGLTYGPGWFCLPRGHFIGNPVSEDPMFDGALSAIGASRLRNAFRREGDRFRSPTTDQVIADDGYRASPWQAATSATAGVVGYGLAATHVEPTTNTGLSEGGEKVFRCTTGGTTGVSEPDWDDAVAINDTVNDNDVVWTLVGYTPPTSNQQHSPKTRTQFRAVSVQTTTDDVDQVIVTGGVVDGIDMALPDNTITRVTDLVILRKPGTADGGTIEVKSDWVRDGGGAPVQLGASVITYNLTGASLDGVTVSHDTNGYRVELLASPETAETLNWRVMRTQVEGVD